ncbi:MAG: lysophospholipid acyltransferase family protein [Candidatus Binatia bacterium]
MCGSGPGSAAAARYDDTDEGQRYLGRQVFRAPRVIDWLTTLPFLLTFGATLLCFDPLQRIARMFGSRAHEFVVGLLQRCLVGALRLCGTRLVVERSPRVRPGTSYLFIANHQSMFDIPILGALHFSNYPKYVAKRELARWIPSISYNLRRGGNAVIDRRNRTQAENAIREVAATAQERGVSAVIYPEGTRARSGELGRFKASGTRALLGAAPEIPVVPVAIDNSWKLLANNLLPVPFGTRIHVYVGEPISRHRGEDPDEIASRARHEIASALIRWRKEASVEREPAAEPSGSL